jgi:hypothetical protein
MGRVEHGLPRGQYGLGLPGVDHRRRQQAQPPVVMFVVLPVEELAARVQGVLEASKTVGDSGRYFIVSN